MPLRKNILWTQLTSTANVPFPPVFNLYINTIPVHATYAVVQKPEAKRTAKLNDCELYKVADAGCKAFILATVASMWYNELRCPEMIYLWVTPWVLPAHLNKVCKILHEIDVVTISLTMPTIITQTASPSK